jgi:hypothetical protein
VGKADGQFFTLPSAFTSAIINVFDRVGEVQLWVNGKSVIEITGLILREDEALHIKGMHFQTFFGGKHLLRPSAISACQLSLLCQATNPIGHRQKTRRLGLRTSREQSFSETSELLAESFGLMHWLRMICNYLFRHATRPSS